MKGKTKYLVLNCYTGRQVGGLYAKSFHAGRCLVNRLFGCGSYYLVNCGVVE